MCYSGDVDSCTDEPSSKRQKIDVNCIEGTKVMVLENGPVVCNQSLTHVIRTVKPHIKQLVEDANLVSIVLKGFYQYKYCFRNS